MKMALIITIGARDYWVQNVKFNKIWSLLELFFDIKEVDSSFNSLLNQSYYIKLDRSPNITLRFVSPDTVIKKEKFEKLIMEAGEKTKKER